MRVIGIDLGRRRIGVAISDATAVLARPVGSIPGAAAPAEAARSVLNELRRLEADEAEGIEMLVVGLPRHLDGSPSPETGWTLEVVDILRTELPYRVALQDERLSSHEAEGRLGSRIRDWRERKARLDAASAAVILQDYLDARAAAPLAGAPEE